LVNIYYTSSYNIGINKSNPSPLVWVNSLLFLFSTESNHSKP